METKVIFFFAIILFISITSAEVCDLQTTLLNQDPYPAFPGDYMKLVFQVAGFDNPECGDMNFELLEDYPLRFNPGETGLRYFSQTSFLQNYESNILIPYEVRIDEDALDGENQIEVRINNFLEKFNLEIKDTKADFEIYVRDYKYDTNTLTLEILNIEKVDIEALTITIHPQENIIIKGPFNVIVGDLDSNEYSTADFEAIVSNGNIAVELTYTDSINIRRKIIKNISFDDNYFLNRIVDEEKSKTGKYVILVIVVLFFLLIYLRKNKKNKKNV
jgi:hypothetical protein